jgi:hypothetical protein
MVVPFVLRQSARLIESRAHSGSSGLREQSALWARRNVNMIRTTPI